MSRYGVKQQKNTKGGKYYWKLQKWVSKLFILYDKCVICNSKKNLEPHHIVPVKPYDELYSDVNNGIVLCKSCHHNYHEQYKDNINTYTLLKFTKENIKLNKKLEQSNELLNYYQNETFRLRNELKKITEKKK